RPDYSPPPKEAPARAPEPAMGSPTEAPPPRMHQAVSIEPARPMTTLRPQRREPAPRARDPRDPLGHVLATLAESVDIGTLVPPEANEPERWREVRGAVDAAIQRLESEGGSAGDREALTAAAVQEAIGLGPLGALLDDPGVLEIVVEGPSAILVDRGSGLAAVGGRFSSSDQLITIIGRLISRAGGSFDGASALQEATLPDGAHLLAVLPPVAIRGPVLEIRRTGRAPVTGESLVQQGMITGDMLGTLRAAVTARRNVVVVGGGELGVSAVASMLANLADAEDRVLAIEAAPELALAATHAVRLTASSRVSLGELLAQAPRLRADRVVIDGVSGAEARTALLLLASRGAGCVLGVRSAPTGSALDHVEALAAMDGGSDTIGRLLASAIHVIVRLGRDANGVRRVLSIAEITSDEGVPTALELWVHTGEFNATGHTASFQR
nr:Flp pilus assembly complex ATPase component TadA [Myxococcota bacterium]